MIGGQDLRLATREGRDPRLGARESRPGAKHGSKSGYSLQGFRSTMDLKTSPTRTPNIKEPEEETPMWMKLEIII